MLSMQGGFVTEERGLIEVKVRIDIYLNDYSVSNYLPQIFLVSKIPCRLTLRERDRWKHIGYWTPKGKTQKREESDFSLESIEDNIKENKSRRMDSLIPSNQIN